MFFFLWWHSLFKSFRFILKSYDKKNIVPPTTNEPCKPPDSQGSSSNDVNDTIFRLRFSGENLILKPGTWRRIRNFRRLVINHSYGCNKLLAFILSHDISCYWKRRAKQIQISFNLFFVKDIHSHLLVEKAKVKTLHTPCYFTMPALQILGDTVIVNAVKAVYF